MSNPTYDAVEAPTLSPVQRIIDTFVAPSKTFEDVRRSSGWWVPYLIAAVVGVLYAFVVLHKIGAPALVEDAIHQSSRLESSISSATPADAARIRAAVANQFKVLYAGPVFSILVGLAAAGILLATANFGAGGRATYKQMLGVWFYSTLPLVLFYVLVIVAIYGGVVGDSFNIKNPIGTNVGFYMASADIPKTVLPFLSAIDLFAIWTSVLLTIGVSTVSGIKRGAAATIVIGWWIVFILLQTVGAAFS